MIISMRLHATKDEVAQVCARIQEFGYKVHSIEGEERVVIGVVGVGDVTACLESLEATPGVEKAVRISAPYKFVSQEFRPAKTEITVRGRRHRRRRIRRHGRPLFGGKREADPGNGRGRGGAPARKLLRGGAFKPRTSPYDFQGLEEEGLKLLRKARRADRPGDHHGSDERPRRGPGGRVRRHPADRRAQHAELRAAQDARQCGRPVMLKRGHELDDQGIADVGRVRGGPRQSAT